MSLSDVCSTFITTAKLRDETERNIIEFAEAPWGLGMGSSADVPPLFPVQKFIFKCSYNIPLDDTDHRIIIKDRFNEKERYRFTEKEYLKFLGDEGRINISEVTGDPKDIRPDLLLVIGRRGCKSSSIAILTAFETYKLLKKYCPQQYYRIMPDQEIRISCIATNQEQAAEVFRMITGHLERSEYFAKFRNKPTLSYMQLSTLRDVEQYGPGQRPSIRIVAAPCSGRGLRGHNNIMAILDEMAYFFETESSVDRSDENIYSSVTPSVAKFNAPNGDPHGRIVCISSPAATTGKFFKLFQRAMEPDCNNLLMIKAPTWEVDYTLSPKFLRAKYSENPITYSVEYGAEFSDRVQGWIENEQVLRMNIVPGLKLKNMSYEQVPHFMGIDVGLKGDGTAVVITHPVRREVRGQLKDYIELDLAEVRYAEDEDKEYFPPDEIADWILSFTSKFHIVKGVMDRYHVYSFLAKFQEKSVKYIEGVTTSRDYNSQVFQNLMSKMLDGSLRIPEGDEQVVNGNKNRDIPLVSEMLKLRATHHNKYLISVEAPDIKGMHDDLSDAYARSVFLCTEYLASGGSGRNAGNAVTGSSRVGGNMSYRQYLRKQKVASMYTHRPSTAVVADMQRRAVNSMQGRFSTGPSRWR